MDVIMSRLLLLALILNITAVFGSDNITLHSEFRCASLAELRIPNINITIAEIVPEGDFISPAGQTYAVPEFCRVRTISTPTKVSKITFEVWLPI